MKIQAILDKTITGLGYELVDVEISPAKLVRVYIDRDTGITIDDCELVSNHLSKLLLVEEIDYSRLEVSSPGVERPLRKLHDFVRFNGKLAKVKLRHLVNEEKVFQGVIAGVDGEVIKLQLESNEIITFGVNDINKARLVLEVKKPFKSNRQRKK